MSNAFRSHRLVDRCRGRHSGPMQSHRQVVGLYQERLLHQGHSVHRGISDSECHNRRSYRATTTANSVEAQDEREQQDCAVWDLSIGSIVSSHF